MGYSKACRQPPVCNPGIRKDRLLRHLIEHSLLAQALISTDVGQVAACSPSEVARQTSAQLQALLRCTRWQLCHVSLAKSEMPEPSALCRVSSGVDPLCRLQRPVHRILYWTVMCRRPVRPKPIPTMLMPVQSSSSFQVALAMRAVSGFGREIVSATVFFFFGILTI